MNEITRSDIHVGCSGWMYRHWRGIFYPEGVPQKRGFERYAEEVRHRRDQRQFLPTAARDYVRGLARQGAAGLPPIKVNRFITHLKKLADCEPATADFIALARPLGTKLGPLLYQLPPSLHKNLERLEAFIAGLPIDLEQVVEFRHASWYDEDVLALLGGYGIGFVTHDLRDLVSPRWASGRTAYVRFHGTAGKYWGRYSDEELLGWTDWCVEQTRLGRSVWCYFNNDIHGHAIEDARTLKSMVE